MSDEDRAAAYLIEWLDWVPASERDAFTASLAAQFAAVRLEAAADAVRERDEWHQHALRWEGQAAAVRIEERKACIAFLRSPAGRVMDPAWAANRIEREEHRP